MEKASPSGIGHASSNHTSGAAYTSDIEYPSGGDSASSIDHSFGVEHAPDNAGPSTDGEAPPAYHQLIIEGLGGNVSAQVMRMQMPYSINIKLYY